MTDVVFMRTSLPGLPDVRIWLHSKWIVVQHADLVSSRHYGSRLTAEEAGAMTGALAEAHRCCEPCCDMHGRNCEPPADLCCERCTEAAHRMGDAILGWHLLDGSVCSNPDLSGNGQR